MKKYLLSLVLALVATWAFAARPKHIFLFIGDGMSTPQIEVAAAFAKRTGLGKLAMNTLPVRASTRTQSANALVTDSAAAATAIACGVKTANGRLGVDADGTRVESVAEVAKKAGMKVGIMTTVPIVHATPAGFYAHNMSRGASYQIGLDLIASDFDYFAGSGVYKAYDNKKDAKYKGNLFNLAREAGYVVCRNDREAWSALKPGSKSWSAFGDGGMSFSIDADGREPTLAEFVAKGIEVMEGPSGFFLMCEGGKVDYAGHANDAATNLRDLLSLDAAVKVALDFQKKHSSDTLVVVTGDHETGGLTPGFAGIGGKFKIELLAKQKVSCEKFSSDVKKQINDRKGEITFDEMRPQLRDLFGLDKLSADEEKKLRDAFEKDVAGVKAKLQDTTAHDVQRRYVFAQAVKNVLNARAGIGWSSGSHTALPTPVLAKGAGAETLKSVAENSDIGNRLKDLLQKK